ncbi:sensor histidine kinase [Gorillibacterium sp. sgz5001074]|uniref:sensor histidine kinase n=1 Tax=Gorillibacterium sp. sgz5001074 TaxID=3446695 RepID=UPI003F682178
MKKPNKSGTLSRWFFLSTVRTALIPLILVEFVFIAVYFFANDWVKDQNVRALAQTASDELVRIADREGAVIQNRLKSISNMTLLYQRQVTSAFELPAVLEDQDRDRLQHHPEGAYYTAGDRRDGGAAVFYSGLAKVGPGEENKVSRLLRTQSLMKDLIASEPLAAAIYVNTSDSLNIIYPYIDALSQYPMKMDIPTYNFYYEADLEHNPGKEVKWTSPYLDPAGNGWMASSIAPVYRDGVLEAVVGLDVTVDTFAKQVTELAIPWEGYGVLVSQDGTILALPNRGEEDWGLSELTTHHYDEAIRQDTFKPEKFNLYSRPELAPWREQIREQAEGLVRVELNGKKRLASWSTIPGIDWKLMVLVPEAKIYAVPNSLKIKLFTVGTWMLAGLILFYITFFLYLLWMARRSSHKVTEPLVSMNRVVREISQGHYRQELLASPIVELNETGANIVRMGEELGRYRDRLVSAKEAAEQASRAKSDFLSRMSHELRTPMNAILGFAQLLELNLDGGLSPNELDQVREIIRAGEHLLSLINEVLDLSRIESGASELALELFSLGEVAEECMALVAGLAIRNGIDVHLDNRLEGDIRSDRTRLKQVLLNLLSNAIKYNKRNGHVRVVLDQSGDRLRIEVADTGIGIPEEELERIFAPFHRVEAPAGTVIEGTGIGLTVAKQIVEGMGGRIGVESRPHEGSRFWIEL